MQERAAPEAKPETQTDLASAAHDEGAGPAFTSRGAIPPVAAIGQPGASASASDRAYGKPPAHEATEDKIDAGKPSAKTAETEKLAALAAAGDVAGFTTAAKALSKPERESAKAELVREHRFDRMPMAMQVALSDSPYHQESMIEGGSISCTTAVRIEGVTAEQALAALTQTDWKAWWATSTTSGPPPSFDFVPEAPLKMIPGFHLNVAMGGAQQEGKNWRLPARLAGTFSGEAEMYIESVDGGVVVHDTWMGMKLSNTTMERVGGVGFWTNGHLQALRGAMAGGMLGPTGFAGLRKYLQANRKA